jgi:hypothetical protein
LSPGSEEKSSAISSASMKWTLLDNAQLWLDFDGTEGEALAMATNLMSWGWIAWPWLEEG